LDKTGLLNRRLLVSKARTRNPGDLTSLWKKTVLELKDSRTFYDADDIPKWLNRLHPLDDYRNFPWEDTTIAQSIRKDENGMIIDDDYSQMDLDENP